MSVLRKRLGDAGERLARQWYEQRGYDWVTSNWRCPQGEVDLVVRRPGLLVFCEVKTRRSAGFGDPREAITRLKLATMRHVAGAYLAAQQEAQACNDNEAMRVVNLKGADAIRLDVACVYWGQPPRVQIVAGVGD